MINDCSFIGNLGKDPKVNTLKSGSVVANFSMACGGYKAKDGTVYPPEWINFVAFGKTADYIAKWIKKGSLMYIQGRLQTRKWDDQDGNTRYTTEIVVNNAKGLSRDKAQGSTATAQVPSKQEQQDDDDIPF